MTRRSCRMLFNLWLVFGWLVGNAQAYYGPQLGRFMQRDPIEYRGGTNLYGYVGGMPTRHVDPFGREGWLPDYLQGGEGWAPDYFQGQEGWVPDFVWGPTSPYGQFVVGLGQGAGNTASTVGSGLKESACQCADLAGSGAELGNYAVAWVVVTSTGYQIPIYHHGDWSATSQGLTSGQLGYGQYYGNTGANLVTFGLYGQGQATYQYATGQITLDEYSGQMGAAGLFQLGGAYGMRPQTGIFGAFQRPSVQMAPQGLGPNVLQYSGNIAQKPFFTDVYVHGSPSSFHVWHNGNWATISHRTLALYLRKQGVTGNLRLLSCEAGKGSLAQNLSNKLGVTVEAADVPVIIPGGVQRPEPPVLRPTGTWQYFNPGVKPK